MIRKFMTQQFFVKQYSGKTGPGNSQHKKIAKGVLSLISYILLLSGLFYAL